MSEEAKNTKLNPWPSSYIPVTTRGVTPIHEGKIGLIFDAPTGHAHDAIRVIISVEDFDWYVDTVRATQESRYLMGAPFCTKNDSSLPQPTALKYMLIGPQGIGKSRHAAKIAASLGVTRVLDDGYDWPDDLEAAFVANTLFISNAIEFPIEPGTVLFQVSNESDILALIKVLRPTTS